MTRSHLLFSSKPLRTLALGALIVLGQLFAGSVALARARTPEQAAAQFYRWYMQSLAMSQDPLRQSPVQLSMYVSKGLISELKHRMSRKGQHADYFIQAQEFMEDWTTDIKVVRPKVQGNVASVVVGLGATPDTRRWLALTLTRDGGDWKISMVRLA
jgi:Protein of unknown function (DUF3828)